MKRFCAILIVFILSLNICMYDKNVYALSGSYPATATVRTVARIMGPAILPFAPQIAVVGMVALGLGVVYQNREQLISMCGGLYRDLIGAGFSIPEADGTYSVPQEAIDYLQTRINGIKSADGKQYITMPISGLGFQNVWGINGITVPAGTIMYFCGQTDVDLGTALWKLNSRSWSVPTTLNFTPQGTYGIAYQYIQNGTVVEADWFDKSIDQFKFVFNGATSDTIFAPQYPTETFVGDITNPSTGTGTVTRPVAVPIRSTDKIAVPSTTTLTVDGTNDWVQSLVGVSSGTDTFPVTQGSTAPGGETPPADGTDLSLPDSVTLDFGPLMNIPYTDKFPFSIPWDIKNSFSTLLGTATPPVWDLDFTHFLGGTHYVINFSIFNKWAMIIRWGILIIFNIGLIMKTRDIIRG